MAASVYLVRHAIAADAGDEWPDDTKRPLTRKGAARMREIAAGLVALGVEIDAVITSPLVRARETAELLVGALPNKPVVGVSTALAPGLDASSVAEMLSRHAKTGSVALVGHEPGLGEFAAWLIGASQPIPVKKGGVIRIDVPQMPPLAGSGQLVWAATPRMVRSLVR
ncbi:MAG: phosphohistidine phosphatase SixA [Acidobacteria bacterium]|nr:phosphohistidine phosphatase SixA [Acidobacteriota bacterium]